MKCPKQGRRRRTKEEERRQERTRRRTKTYQRSRTTLELSCTVIDNRKRERGEREREERTSAHAQISNASKTERFLKIEEMISYDKRTISQTASYFNGNKTNRSFPPWSRSGSANCCSSEGIFVVLVCVCVYISREDDVAKKSGNNGYKNRRFDTRRKKREKTKNRND